MNVVSVSALLWDSGMQGSAVRNFSPFQFSTEPSDTLAVRGAQTLLNCSVHSEFPAKIEWKKDGSFLSLASDDRRQVLADGSLLISSVVHSKHNKPDEGVYQCVATIDNLGTIISRTARLSVAVDMQRTIRELAQARNHQQNLCCGLRGPCSCSSVCAMQLHTSQEKPVQTGIPRYLSQPEAASVRVGDSHVLNCEVNPDLVSFIRWEQNKEPVELDQRVFTLPSGALVISNATEADAGLYRCVIDNAGPTKTSEEAEIQILPESGEERTLEFLLEPQHVSKVIGESVLLPCVVTGHPTAYVTWTHKDQLIEYREHIDIAFFSSPHSKGRFEVLGGGSLRILSLTEEDAGVYSCMADSVSGSIEAQTVLTLKASPQFLKKPANIYAHEATDVTFECEVTGSPAPTIKWVKNGDAVIPSDYFKIIKEQNLLVLGLVKSDEGFYQCLAENDAGNVQSSAQLIILDQEILWSSRAVYEKFESPQALKKCESYSWERIVNTSRPGEMQVTIQNLMPDTKYSFRVVAHNRNGPGESSAPLRVATQPEVQVPGPAPNLHAVVMSPTTVSLSWDMPLTGNGEIQNYKIYYMEKGMDSEQDLDVNTLSYTMTGLKKFTEYSFRVVAYNKHGPGVSTEDISVRTYSDVPSAPPQNTTFEVLNSK
ncbi:hypothetical protein cypCar_00016834, partial [Cyprinus carpio]